MGTGMEMGMVPVPAPDAQNPPVPHHPKVPSKSPLKPAELGGRVAGSSMAGSSPAEGLAWHHASPGSRGVGREAVAGPGEGGYAPPEEILVLIFHPKRHPRSITWLCCAA